MKRETKKAVKHFTQSHRFKRQLTINQQTIQLLLHDPSFIVWAKSIRSQFGIPAEGFRPLSKSIDGKPIPSNKKPKKKQSTLEVWFKNHDIAELDSTLRGVYNFYTKVNESFLPYIRSYVLYDKVIEDPMFGYKVQRAELDGRKLAQVTVDIYFPLINEEWEALKDEVNGYFEDLGISGQPSLIEHFKRHLISLKEKLSFYDHETGLRHKETDLDLMTKLYPQTPIKELKRLALNLPKDRKRIKQQIEQRLGEEKKQ